MKISEIARMARVSVRTLHHYDAIGLLSPAVRAAGDERRYTKADLERLTEIRRLASLGLPLDRIGEMLDEPEVARNEALKEHRARLAERAAHLDSQLRAVDRLLDDDTDDATGDAFEELEEAERHREAESRWGHTSKWKESQRRVAGYDARQMASIERESREILEELGALCDAGRLPNDAEAMELAEAYRLHIDRWFYPLSRDAHVDLANLYVDDVRFRRTFESVASGLARFAREAIRANADRDDGTVGA